MNTLRSQTRSHEYMRGFSLPVKSPYFQTIDSRKMESRQEYKLIPDFMNDFLIVELLIIGGNPYIGVSLSDSTTHAFNSTQILPMTWADIAANGLTATINVAIAAYAATNSLTVGVIEGQIPAIPAMLVGGVAKTNTYAVAAAPTVAGGAGVVRFYIDSHGDGTGTAPSEVEIATLQAVVVNSTTAYVPTNITVDTSRKYIDVTMKSVTFGGVTVLGVSVLGSQTLTAAANGTAVNCFVIVKQ